jgi:hypothetical protein
MIQNKIEGTLITEVYVQCYDTAKTVQKTEHKAKHEYMFPFIGGTDFISDFATDQFQNFPYFSFKHYALTEWITWLPTPTRAVWTVTWATCGTSTTDTVRFFPRWFTRKSFMKIIFWLKGHPEAILKLPEAPMIGDALLVQKSLKDLHV